MKALQPGTEERRTLDEYVRDVQFVTVPRHPSVKDWEEDGSLSRAAMHGVRMLPSVVFLDSKGRVFDLVEGCLLYTSDPKENGALMIVLWQLTVLHARKAGWLSSWLLHFSNVVGGVIIAFAWWGVNMLGVGLHSYGFTSGRDALDMFYGCLLYTSRCV